MSNDAYIRGFTEKCAELGVDPAALQKLAYRDEEEEQPRSSKLRSTLKALGLVAGGGLAGAGISHLVQKPKIDALHQRYGKDIDALRNQVDEISGQYDDIVAPVRQLRDSTLNFRDQVRQAWADSAKDR